ncbi:hypothetical protein [Pontibacter diazotrophicus]|nr:hypothetical protein [Pontibacter diazotrophicus]
MNKAIFLTALLTWAALSAADAQQIGQGQSVSPLPVTIELNPQKKYQTMESIGGNFAQANYTKDARDTALTIISQQPPPATPIMAEAILHPLYLFALGRCIREDR